MNKRCLSCIRRYECENTDGLTEDACKDYLWALQLPCKIGDQIYTRIKNTNDFDTAQVLNITIGKQVVLITTHGAFLLSDFGLIWFTIKPGN